MFYEGFLILICSIIRKRVFIAASAVNSEVQRKRCFRATRMSARSTRLCTRDFDKFDFD